MSKFGDYLKKARDDKGLSLARVHELTGITNSRLSKAENGADTILNPAELRQLASLYGRAVVPMYIMAGYMIASDLEEYRSGFRNTELLDDEEKEHIQNQIDFIIKIKRKKDEQI